MYRCIVRLTLLVMAPMQCMIDHGNTNHGTQSLNLLGGQQEVPPDPADLQPFDVTVDSVCMCV